MGLGAFVVFRIEAFFSFRMGVFGEIDVAASFIRGNGIFGDWFVGILEEAGRTVLGNIRDF